MFYVGEKSYGKPHQSQKQIKDSVSYVKVKKMRSHQFTTNALIVNTRMVHMEM